MWFVKPVLKWNDGCLLIQVLGWPFFWVDCVLTKMCDILVFHSPVQLISTCYFTVDDLYWKEVNAHEFIAFCMNYVWWVCCAWVYFPILSSDRTFLLLKYVYMCQFSKSCEAWMHPFSYMRLLLPIICQLFCLTVQWPSSINVWAHYCAIYLYIS